VTIGLLSMALMDIGVKARSYTGGTGAHPDRQRLHQGAHRQHRRGQHPARSRNGFVVVVAGFQGVDEDGNITTLGRGGSDTSAVAIAAALKADECQIYTDVDGVYTTDPRIVPEARRLETVTFEEMLEWPASAPRCCRSARSSSPASTRSSCACCPAWRNSARKARAR
jgi:aspartate kinase